MAKKKCKTKIGGQAVMEGVMMRGETSMATVVRDERGVLRTETKRFKSKAEKPLIFRVPFVRGVLSFFSSLVLGMKTLMRSAAVFGEVADEKPSKFEIWLAKKLKTDVMDVVMAFALVFGVALAVGIFIFLPRGLTELLSPAFNGMKLANLYINLIDGGLRLFIFIGYLLLVSLIKDVRRVFMYHGAEHKVINCFEAGAPLTVGNAREQTKVHDRCGTSFMFIVMVISIFLITVADFWNDNFWISLLIRLALLPVVAGVSFEILMFLSKFDNPFVKILKAPGLLIQKLTTKEPDDDMLEVAIEAFFAVQKMDADKSVEPVSFDVYESYAKSRKKVLDAMGAHADEAAADWIFCEVFKIDRVLLPIVTKVRESQTAEAVGFAREMADGKPLQQVLGNTNFYGYKIKVNANVLCPRPETEILTEIALSVIMTENKVLDLCTGSGAVAVAIKKKKPETSVFASDISAAALETARENAKENDAEITFIESDLFEKISEKFDVIVSNPPYIKTAEIENLDKNVKDFEPHIALDGGADGLSFYKKIISKAGDFLNGGGRILFEVGIGQAEEVSKMLTEAGFSNIEIKKDLEGIDRVVQGAK